MPEEIKNTRTLINHIYSHRPRTPTQQKRSSGMNEAMLKAAINKLEKSNVSD